MIKRTERLAGAYSRLFVGLMIFGVFLALAGLVVSSFSGADGTGFKDVWYWVGFGLFMPFLVGIAGIVGAFLFFVLRGILVVSWSLLRHRR